MNRGYVKVWRKVQDSGLIQMHETFALFMYLLLNATHKDIKLGTTNGVIYLKRGEYVSGRIELSKQLKMSEQQIRTCLARLQSLSIISIKSTNKYSVYVIENYSNYQEDNQQINQQSTSNQPTDNQQITTKQTHKHINTKELNTYVSNDVANCPHDEIIKLYAEHLPMLTQVKVWSDSRQKLLKARWREDKKRQSIEWWLRFFKFIAKSDFLTGKISDWQADIEWILNAKNFIKILEGKYDNKSET